ncbi:hypothetical protein G9A89_004221 [Geosiphon pyriformis]|nr:hypothetical protein G9A89_004221 [Geosiphon pyriformis]
MKPVGFSAGGFSSVSAGLGIWSNNKKKACIKSIYSCGPLYKKSKVSGAISDMVDLLAGPIPGSILQTGDLE